VRTKEQKGKKKILWTLWTRPDFVRRRGPKKSQHEEEIQNNCECVAAFLHYLLSRIQKIDYAEFTINQRQSERIVVSR